jgi:hypothetical protein
MCTIAFIAKDDTEELPEDSDPGAGQTLSYFAHFCGILR